MNLYSLSFIDTINDYIQPFIDQALTFFQGMGVWLQGLILLALAIFTIIGLVVFIKKFIKLFLVLGVLAVIVYFVWTKTTIIQDLIGSLSGAMIVPKQIIASIFCMPF